MRTWTTRTPYRRKVLVLAAMLLVAACAEEVNLGTAPTLEFVSASTTTIRAADEPGVPGNTIVFTFNYSDGDGDLGSGEGSGRRYDIRIVDKRPGYPFETQEIDDATGDTTIILLDSLQENSTNYNALFDQTGPISGTLRVTLLNVPFTPPRNAINTTPPAFPRPVQQFVQFNIQLVDRAGNRSNSVLTPQILITR